MTTRERQRPLLQDHAELRRRRLLAGMSQAALARQAGIGVSHASLIESGRRSAGVELLGRLAGVLGCEVGDLMAPEALQGVSRP
ncbi:helix-turn-helix domain-containing protein [Sphaerisporangium sp. NPDC049003]|uniref:helix-turn-helix domain-containing protein n=1 Tax=Sphaerisporangium sp. NPDC049003 TaxID=3364517 RepID=UPI003719E7C0